MRWVLLSLLVAGCGAPPAEEHPFLRLRHSDQQQAQEQQPDAGGLQPVPAGDPGDPVE